MFQHVLVKSFQLSNLYFSRISQPNNHQGRETRVLISNTQFLCLRKKHGDLLSSTDLSRPCDQLLFQSILRRNPNYARNFHFFLLMKECAIQKVERNLIKLRSNQKLHNRIFFSLPTFESKEVALT